MRRQYEERPIPRAVLEQVLSCGEAAPSSKNAQPWRFHVVVDRPMLREIAQAVSCADGVETYVPRDPRTGEPYPHYDSTALDSARVLSEVPAAIFIENLGAFSAGRSTLLGVTRDALAGSLIGYGFELIGIGTAVENLWIAANALGLSAAFMGDVVIAEDDVKRLLAFDGDLAGVLVLGYSLATPRPSALVRSFDDVHRVVWHV